MKQASSFKILALAVIGVQAFISCSSVIGEYANRGSYDKKFLFSVRCLKN
jgi:hypothetical protein